MITVNEKGAEKREFKPFTIEIHINDEGDCTDMLSAMTALYDDYDWSFAEEIVNICKYRA